MQILYKRRFYNVIPNEQVNSYYGVVLRQHWKNAYLSLIFLVKKVLVPGYIPVKDGRRLS